MADPAGSIEESVAAELAAAMTAIGLPAGASLLVHSGILPVVNEFRRRGVRDRNLRARACMCFDRALQIALGADGTVCVPGFFYDYARHGLTFDARTAEPDSALGAYPPYFRAHRMEHRSLNPLANLMLAGPKAQKIAAVPSVYGNGVGSPWFQLVEEDAWMLFFGASPRTMTFCHHVEHLVGVPHLYNKLYRVPIIDLAGRRYDRSFCSVRFLDRRFAIVYQLDKFLEAARKLGILLVGQWQSTPIYLARLQPAQAHLTAKLIEDPYFLLETKPSFARKELPDDGPSPVDDAVR